jgi:hypothetical protein
MVMPADQMPGPEQGHWTYKDYAALPDDGHRYEIVDGVLYMAPSPMNGTRQLLVVYFVSCQPILKILVWVESILLHLM